MEFSDMRWKVTCCQKHGTCEIEWLTQSSEVHRGFSAYPVVSVISELLRDSQADRINLERKCLK